MSGVAVVLNQEEMVYTEGVAMKRPGGRYRGTKIHKHRLRWPSELLGTRGEYAVSKYCRMYWAGSGNRSKVPDVDIFEVRTRHKFRGTYLPDFHVYENDPDDRIIVCVMGNRDVMDFNEFTILGFIWGKEAKRKEWWETPSGNAGLDFNAKGKFFVPAMALHHIDIAVEFAVSHRALQIGAGNSMLEAWVDFERRRATA